MSLSHQELGRDLELFFFDDVSPGSCFFLPKGQYIYNKLIALIRELYEEFGYSEVSTPVICSSKLWKTSGHYDKYKDNMFFLNKTDEGDVEYSLAPMNCPKHILIYNHMNPSYRDLPIRLADFGALHRNEASGALRGLTRVRLFHQDDAHVMCREDQIEEEIKIFLEMLSRVYKLFNFEYTLSVSTRPDNYIGSLALWDDAEDVLKKIVTSRGALNIKEGDGAFYGPKIDVMVKDNVEREHQLGTVQLDFNGPIRFDMIYKGWDDGKYTPVIVHRAILGSLERFIAILLEHTQGHLPLWISPRKIAIIPVNKECIQECISFQNSLITTIKSSFGIDLLTNETVSKLIREGEVKRYNYTVVIGKREKETKTVSIRENNGSGSVYLKSQDEFVSIIKEEYQTRQSHRV
jgi:threonyl-tRNA synthetase